MDTDWLDTLSPDIRAALDVADDVLNDFAGSVRMAEALARLAFRRAVQGVSQDSNEYVELGDEDNYEGITEYDINARMNVALRANAEAAKIKELRLQMLEKFEDVVDQPKPANIRFNVVETPKEDQVARLRAIGFYKEAEELENA